MVLEVSTTYLLSRDGIEVKFGQRSYFFASLDHLAEGTSARSETQMARMAFVVYNHHTDLFDKHRYCNREGLNVLLPIARKVGIDVVRQIDEMLAPGVNGHIIVQELENFV